LPDTGDESRLAVNSAASGHADERMAMDIGPVKLIVLTFPGERADRAVAEALAEVVAREYATVLDVVFLTRTSDGLIRIIDADENLDDIGLGSLKSTAQTLISEDDLDIVRGSLKPGRSAAVIAYEDRRAQRLSGVIEAAGGTVALHVRVRSAWARSRAISSSAARS
jgi:Family of unknown function (DUF6325)